MTTDRQRRSRHRAETDFSRDRPAAAALRRPSCPGLCRGLLGPYQQLLKRGLIIEESDQHQYRFKDIVDPKDGKMLYTIEHEVRSMKHPIYMRPLVNRNPAQNNMNYAPGFDAWTWGMPNGD